MVEERYLRNLPAISGEEQERLESGNVLIVGCGGLGGSVLAYLLRLGVGNITVVDCDRFDETNLNRQLLCTMENLGELKTDAAEKYAALINPHVRLTAVKERLTGSNARELVRGHALAVDALDNIESRRTLASACAAEGVPLVYGAIHGWVVQAAVLHPEHIEAASAVLYPEGAALSDKACLAFAPGICAGVQAAECVKLLLGKSSELDGRLLFMDLLHGDTEYISLI